MKKKRKRIRKMKEVTNKWTGNVYTVLNMTDKEVTLRRSDGSEFTIAKYEYYFNYRDGK